MTSTQRGLARRAARVLGTLGAVLVVSSACADPGGDAIAGAGQRPATARSTPPTTQTQHTTQQPARQPAQHRPPAVPLGAGLVSFPGTAAAWVKAHPHDPRTASITKRIADRPSSLWLTGNESFANLAQDASMAKAQNRTMLLTLWNIPLRYDGLTDPSTITLAKYKQWVSKVAAGLRGNRAIIVLEPDALWFYDRLPSAADRRTRLAALRYAVTTIGAKDSRARVYLDAGTSSGSVTPTRMAALLVAAGVKNAAGYAVNVSSYSPTKQIQAYAQGIRTALKSRGLADPRYVTDTGRNGASTWNNDWCNPGQQRLGAAPGVVRSTDGRDLNLWIKAPGTSDGDCGAPGEGAGSYGGQFLPAVAYRMITG